MKCRALLLACAASCVVRAEPPADRFGPDDLDRLAQVSGPQFSPDGAFLVYTLTTANVAADRPQSDIWRVRYDGSERIALTSTPEADESLPRYAPDGSGIAYLASGADAAPAQVWWLPAGGGAARALTRLPGDVEDYAWSPDGRQLAVIAWDAERAAGEAPPKHPPPIVTTRFQFKEDGTGYLGARRKHLYLVDVAIGGGCFGGASPAARSASQAITASCRPSGDQA